MSFARFGWNSEGGPPSDVYVFLAIEGHLECSGCSLGDCGRFDTTEAMLAHLSKHVAAGNTVPDEALARLRAERDETDAFIAERFGPREQGEES